MALLSHRLFQLHVEHDSRTVTYWQVLKTSQKVMKITLRIVKLFILDNVSMKSTLNLVYMYMRLDELFGGTNWFGGKSILLFGDLLQLEPVNGTTIFDRVW